MATSPEVSRSRQRVIIDHKEWWTIAGRPFRKHAITAMETTEHGLWGIAACRYSGDLRKPKNDDAVGFCNYCVHELMKRAGITPRKNRIL